MNHKGKLYVFKFGGESGSPSVCVYVCERVSDSDTEILQLLSSVINTPSRCFELNRNVTAACPCTLTHTVFMTKEEALSVWGPEGEEADEWRETPPEVSRQPWHKSAGSGEGESTTKTERGNEEERK